MAGDTNLQSFYSLSSTAMKARDEMDQAVKLGQVQRYHQILRDSPHVRYVKDLTRARKHLDVIAQEIRDTNLGSLPPDHKQLYISQLRRDMSSVAKGTLTWLNSKLNEGSNAMAVDG